MITVFFDNKKFIFTKDNDVIVVDYIYIKSNRNHWLRINKFTYSLERIEDPKYPKDSELFKFIIEGEISKVYYLIYIDGRIYLKL